MLYGQMVHNIQTVSDFMLDKGLITASATFCTDFKAYMIKFG